MSTTEIKTNQKSSQSFSKGDEIETDITSSTKDIFEGQVLIDRLLLYYSKFEGSRERATHYAQKLLDLGHIECLTNGVKFEDSAHIYRWADANKVVSEAKSKAMEQKSHNPIVTVARNSNFKETNEGAGKAVLKISIETDNCQTAEIQVSEIHLSFSEYRKSET